MLGPRQLDMGNSGLIGAAAEAAVSRIVHISITNPSEDSPLPYFRGKALVEKAIHESGLSYAILRPTVLFSPEDVLINNIAWFLRRFPAFPIARVWGLSDTAGVRRRPGATCRECRGGKRRCRVSPNPPKDTDGRREESGKGGEGATGEIAWVPFGVGRSADGLHRRTGAPMAVCGSCDARDGERIRSRELSRTGLARVCGDLRLSGGWVGRRRCRQAGSGMARSRAKARLNFSAQGQRSGRCRVNRRAERVSRPAREKNRRRRVLVVAIRSPRPIRAVQRARLWAIVWTASQAPLGGEAARGEMVQPRRRT